MGIDPAHEIVTSEQSERNSWSMGDENAVLSIQGLQGSYFLSDDYHVLLLEYASVA